MLSISFTTSIIAISQIFAMGLVGFLLVRNKVVDDAGLKMLSFISVNIAFPLFIFYQITHHFNPAETPLWWGYPLINICLTLGALAIAATLFAIKGQKPKDEILVCASLHNAGYIPLLLSMTLPLGELAPKVYTAIILSIIGFDLCLWSIGVWLISRYKSPHIELWRMFNPPLISMSGAIILVLLCGPQAIPEFVVKPVKIIGDAAMAISMLVIGGNLAMTNLGKIDFPQISKVVMLKLLVVPLLALIVLSIWSFDPIIRFCIMIQACMPTAITLSIISRYQDSKNIDFVNQSIFVTHLCCMVTLPIFLGIFGKLGF